MVVAEISHSGFSIESLLQLEMCRGSFQPPDRTSFEHEFHGACLAISRSSRSIKLASMLAIAFISIPRKNVASFRKRLAIFELARY